MSLLLKTDLKGKINNLPDFKQEALLPVFEAVVNSIQGLEEAGNPANAKILVRVVRHAPAQFIETSKEEEKIINFEVEDNGVGFDDKNYDSFLTSDSTHKIQKGGKGVGRFFWLRAFETVEIESVYEGTDGNRLRKIGFCPTYGIRQISDEPSSLPRYTRVQLQDFREEYRKLTSAYKTTQKIAQRILEHCLSYYITGRSIPIEIEDGNELLYLSKLFEAIRENIKTETFEIGDEEFTLSHVRLYASHAAMHNLVLCANNRDVKRIDLSKMLGTSLQFDEEGSKFTYCAYVSGSYLDRHVTAGRTEFTFPDQPGDVLADNAFPICLEQIRAQVSSRAKKYLKAYLAVIDDRKKDIVAKHVAENPTLRAVPRYSPEVYDEIEPNSTPEKIHEVLYKHKGRTELEIQKRGKKLLKSQAQSVEKIEADFKRLTDEIEDIQRDNLAGYVILRKMIIDLLDRKLELNTTGRHSNEDIVHDIIFPRKTGSDQLGFEEHNLWLIDEGLTFHEFAVSDKPFNEFSSSESTERADIVTFAEIDDDRVARAVSLIELKKPQRQKIDEDPTKQLYRYVREIKENKITMDNGRPLTVSDNTRFYCYAICDLTRPIREYAENHHYTQLKGELGYYDYNGTLHTHVSIIAFDKIVVDAKRRHHAFFEKLGIQG